MQFVFPMRKPCPYNAQYISQQARIVSFEQKYTKADQGIHSP